MLEEEGIGALLGGVDELGGIDESSTFASDKFDLDRPVPGQSLTEAPGANPWEKPPQQTDPKSVANALFMQSTEPKNARQLLRLMDAGVPIETIVEPILMHGVQEGQWSMDVAMAVGPAYMGILLGMAHRAGVTATLENSKKEEVPTDLTDIKALFTKKKPKATPALEDFQEESAEETAPTGEADIMDSLRRK